MVPPSSTTAPGPQRVGVGYGFGIIGPAGLGPYLLPEPAVGAFPLLELIRSVDPVPQRCEGWEPARAPGGWRVDVHRDGSRARCRPPGPWPLDALVHPGLATAAICVALHRGDDALHAGLVQTPRGCVALLAHRGQGKTTTLAHLATCSGAPVLADDQVIVRAGRGQAGPRCIDLRPDAVDLLGLADRTSVVRGAERRRLDLPPCAPSGRLTGVVVLEWGPTTTVAPVPPPERVGVLAEHRTASIAPRDPAGLLDLARIPMHRVARPRGWAGLEATGRLILDEL